MRARQSRHQTAQLQEDARVKAANTSCHHVRQMRGMVILEYKSILIYYKCVAPNSTCRWGVNPKFEHRAPFFQNGGKSGFEMCFGPSTLGAGAKTRLESRMNSLRHIVFDVPSGVKTQVTPSFATSRILPI